MLHLFAVIDRLMTFLQKYIYNSTHRCKNNDDVKHGITFDTSIVIIPSYLHKKDVDLVFLQLSTLLGRASFFKMHVNCTKWWIDKVDRLRSISIRNSYETKIEIIVLVYKHFLLLWVCITTKIGYHLYMDVL